MPISEIALQRLCSQYLTEEKLQNPVEVVSWFGAVQAQEYALTRFSLWLRMRGVSDAAIEQAFNEGAILRTHAMRPTWHFLSPNDIRWVLDLTSPRVHQFNAYYNRRLELDDALLARSSDILLNALRGQNYLTRQELAAVLSRQGIEAQGQRLAYMVMWAELNGLICSGPRRGNQFTYAVLEERAPGAKTLPREEALAELTTRYFTSHGPALVQDFAWWSSLTVADVKAGIELAKPNLIAEEVGGKTYWRGVNTPVAPPNIAPKSFLMPPYDEFTVAYKDYSPMIDPQYTQIARDTIVYGIILIECQILGSWRREVEKGKVKVEATLFRALSEAEQESLGAAARQYEAHLGMEVAMEVR